MYADESKQKIKSIVLNPTEEVQILYEEYLEDKSNDKNKIFKGKIKETEPMNILFLPKHLKEYVTSQLETQLTSALHAKYQCHEHIQYRLIMDENRGKK